MLRFFKENVELRAHVKSSVTEQEAIPTQPKDDFYFKIFIETLASQSVSSQTCLRVFKAGLFNSKVAIVTGGGTGIGKAITSELLQLGMHFTDGFDFVFNVRSGLQ